MKAVLAAVVLSLSIPAGAALAETTSTGVESCPLSGDATGASDDCLALRASYAGEVGGCMDAMEAEAKGKYGVNAHSMRARHALCAAQARIDLGIDAEGLAAAD